MNLADFAIWQSIHTQHDEIEKWFVDQWGKTPPPFYASVDLRYSGFKLCPIDTNLFPAGFNNIHPSFYKEAISAFQATIENNVPTAKKILIIAEGHTRNLYYLENLATLQNLLQQANYQVALANLAIQETTVLHTIKKHRIVLHPIRREASHLYVEDTTKQKKFYPDLIVLNNDLTDHIPVTLDNLDQPITPVPQLGWKHRTKSHHFGFYSKIAKTFAEKMQFDPWLITPLFRNCGEVDFKNRVGEECMEQNIHTLTNQITIKYREHGIKEEPYLVVKADSGTYGMGVLMIKDDDDIALLNRKQRNEMTKTKSGKKITRVILQEGVPSVQYYGLQHVSAETVCYHAGNQMIGVFYRTNERQTNTGNLNSPGMSFVPMPASADENAPMHCKECIYLYSVISRLAVLAASHEMADIKNREQ